MLIHSTWKLDCDAVYYFIVIGTCAEVFLGQAIFTVRALAVWEYSWTVICLLTVVWLPHIAFSLSTMTAAVLTWNESLVLGDGGFCSLAYKEPQWRYPTAYVLVLFSDLFIMGLVTYKLVQLRHNAGSSLLNLLVRDGIIYAGICALPTIVAIAVFLIADDNASLRSSALTFTCLLHALLACRAFVSNKFSLIVFAYLTRLTDHHTSLFSLAQMNLSNLCERLPTSIRMKVSSGTMLDQDTLARIAFHLGPSLEEKELGLNDPLPRVNKNNNRPSSGNSTKKTGFGGRSSTTTSPNMNSTDSAHSSHFGTPNLNRASYSTPGPIVHTMTQSEWDEDVVREAWDPVENLNNNGRSRLNSFGTETNMSPGSRKEDLDRF